MEKTLKSLSKQLSYILRHHPGSIGLATDQAGWVKVESLLKNLKAYGWEVDRQMLDTVVATNEKKGLPIAKTAHTSAPARGIVLT